MDLYSEGWLASTDDPVFEIGDIVTLVTGSPDMVVVDVCSCGGAVEVCWYDDNGMQFVDLPEESLLLVPIDD